MLENRLVGMKCRGIYETPGGSILYHAHQMLESLCLDKQTQHYKAQIAIKFGQLVYDGLWYTPLREALSVFVDQTQKTVTGTVKLKLYKGNITGAGMTSPYSLYSEDIVTFGEDQSYNQMDSAGFIKLFGLPLEVRARMEHKNKNKNKGA
jgi:argininosuccinate synthase